jgi:competence protein ComEC
LSARSSAPRWLGARERPYDLLAQPMISVAAAAAIGILTDQAASMMPATTFVAFIAFFLLLIAICVWRFASYRRWFFILLAVAFAMAIYSRADQRAYDQATISRIVTDDRQPILLRARVRSDIQRRPALASSFGRQAIEAVVKEPVQTEWQTLFIADVETVRVGDTWQPFNGGLYVMIDDDLSQVGPGDLLELGGNINRFLPPTNPGESDFRTVAQNRFMHARIAVDDKDQVKILETGSMGLRRFADALARDGEQTLNRLLSQEVSPLASALVVGRRMSLDTELKDQLLETGTIHLLSVSGLHLGIVATTMLILSASFGFGRSMQVVAVGTVCFLFAAITGGQPPVLRAAILVATMLTSLLVNRRQWPLNTLAFAALILMLLDPTNLMQVGVSLSFISVATLVCSSRTNDPAAREIEAALTTQAQIDALIDQTRTPRMLWIRKHIRQTKDLAWISLCVTFTTTPLTWLHFNLVSPVAVIANLLLGLPTAVALVSGLIAVVLGWVAEPLAIIPAFVCDVTLKLMCLIVESLSELPFGHAWLPAPPTYWVITYFAALLASFAIKIRLSRPRMFVIGSLIWFVIAWFLAVAPSWQNRTDLRATFIDVGHGTSVLLEMPSGMNYLYDCGRLANDDMSSRGIEDVLWSRGLTGLDAVILSHADADHYNALPGLLERFRIREVVTPPKLFDGTIPMLAEIQSDLKQLEIPIREVSIEDLHLDSNQTLQILHPPKQRIHGDDNANSLVIRMNYGDTSFVLPGDLEPPGTELLINQPRPIPGGVLMAPHHGSLTADSQSILDWARPRAVIVSGGPRAKRPEVAKSLQTRGSDVYVTASGGAIRVIIHDKGVQINRFWEQPW